MTAQTELDALRTKIEEIKRAAWEDGYRQGYTVGFSDGLIATAAEIKDPDL